MNWHTFSIDFQIFVSLFIFLFFVLLFAYYKKEKVFGLEKEDFEETVPFKVKKWIVVNFKRGCRYGILKRFLSKADWSPGYVDMFSIKLRELFFLYSLRKEIPFSISKWISKNLKKGCTKDSLKESLKKEGWNPKYVDIFLEKIKKKKL